MKKWFCFFLIFLAGCGFHLRGASYLPCFLKEASLESDKPSSFLLVLKNELAKNSVTIQDHAAVQFHLIEETSGFQNQSTSPGDQSTQGLEWLRIQYEWLYQNKIPLTEKKTLTVSEISTHFQNQIQSTNSLETRTLESLHRLMALAVISDLSSIKTMHSFQTSMPIHKRSP